VGAFLAAAGKSLAARPSTLPRRNVMPILLWFLGVPLGIVILLMLFGIVSF